MKTYHGTRKKEHHHKDEVHTSENDLEKDPEENFRKLSGILDLCKEMASMK